VLKAGGEQSVTLTGTAEMQQWCAGNWDTLSLVSKNIQVSDEMELCAVCTAFLHFHYVGKYINWCIYHTYKSSSSLDTNQILTNI